MKIYYLRENYLTEIINNIANPIDIVIDQYNERSPYYLIYVGQQFNT
jgi:hypothetical protein